jgi:hypothetical protein
VKSPAYWLRSLVYHRVLEVEKEAGSAERMVWLIRMTHIVDFPFLVFLLSLVTLWLSARIGAIHKNLRPLGEDEQQDFDRVLAATLTLLGLIIGFSFSMVISRYDLRKSYEEAEANAIGTEYLRADLLPAADAAKVRELLKNYLDQRVLFYEARFEPQTVAINSQTGKLQNELWSAVETVAEKQPTPTVALVVSGMNDVLNSQGYTQAAWWNRLPVAAWGLLGAIAIFCDWLIGYGARRKGIGLFLILPLAVSTSFLLIADIDSPRRGMIRVVPQNLVSLSESLRAP